MKRLSIFSKIAIPVLTFFLTAQDVLAQGVGLQPPRPPSGLGRLGANPNLGISGLITYIINILLGIVGIIAVIFLIYGGFRYITAGGGDEGTKEAKGIIKNALIGLIVVILSYVLVIVIINALVNANV
jgi:hypothetical protein